MTKATKTLVLIGCGYLGSHIIGRAAASYAEIISLVRSNKRLEALQKKPVIAKSIDVFNDKLNYQQMCSSPDYEAIFMIPPSAIMQETNAIEKVVSELVNSNCTRGLLISSTGVYGRPKNEVVTAESEVIPNDDRTTKLAAIEQHWLAGGEQFSVLRLAGIYGPNRIVGRRPLAEGRQIGGNSDAWLNLIHVADAASLSLRCLHPGARRIELGSDGSPVKRKDYYNHVAEIFAYPEAEFAGENEEQKMAKSLRNSSSKKCDPSSTYIQLSWTPRYPNYTVGLRASLDAGANDEV